MKPIKLDKNFTDTYNDHEDLKDDLIDNLYDGSYHIRYKEGFLISFMSRELPHCCGVIELGELSNLNLITQEQFDNLMGFILTNNKRTLIINTLNKGNSASWNKFLEESPYFNKIKDFKNPGSENIINIWISI